MPGLTPLLVLLGCLIVFQLALAFGAPLGRFVFGGRHERELPGPLRGASAAVALVYGLMAVISLDKMGLVDVVPALASQTGTWVMVVFFLVGIYANGMSRSRQERFVMAPVALVLFLLSLLVALAPESAYATAL